MRIHIIEQPIKRKNNPKRILCFIQPVTELSLIHIFWHNNTTDYPAELVVKNLATGQEKSTVIPAHTKDHPPIEFFVSSEDCTFDVTIQNSDGHEVGGEFAVGQYQI